jgi:hypothetical protein
MPPNPKFVDKSKIKLKWSYAIKKTEWVDSTKPTVNIPSYKYPVSEYWYEISGIYQTATIPAGIILAEAEVINDGDTGKIGIGVFNRTNGKWTIAPKFNIMSTGDIVLFEIYSGLNDYNIVPDTQNKLEIWTMYLEGSNYNFIDSYDMVLTVSSTMPNIAVVSFDAPSEVVAGESFSATVAFRNYGLTGGNVTFNVIYNGTVLDSDTFEVISGSITTSRDYIIPTAGTYNFCVDITDIT